MLVVFGGNPNAISEVKFTGKDVNGNTYNNQDIKGIVYNGTPIWGKKVGADTTTFVENATISCTRPASPYNHESTSTTIISPSNIRYGDTVAIGMTATSGYQIHAYGVFCGGQVIPTTKYTSGYAATNNFTATDTVNVVCVAKNTGTLTLRKKANIASLSYRVGSSGQYITVTSYRAVEVAIGSTVYLYATAESGYTTAYTSSNPLQITMSVDGYMFEPTAQSAGDWHELWTGSQILNFGNDVGNYGTTTISGLSPSITSSSKLRAYITTNKGNYGYVDVDNEPKSYEEEKRVGNKVSICGISVWAPDYNTSTSIVITARFDYQDGTGVLLYPSAKVTKIEAYY